MESLSRREFGLAGAAIAAGAVSQTAGEAPLSFAAKLSHRLRWAREKAGLSIEQAASAIHVSPAEWQAWEKNAGDMPAADALRAARSLDIEIKWLAEGNPGFVERLRSSREKAGLSISDAANRIAASAADWQAWEDNLAVPSLTQGCEIAELLDVEPRWLGTGHE